MPSLINRRDFDILAVVYR